jgi:ABC-2 type transport system permease protein
MSNVFLIAKREYMERVRAKSFLIMTILIPALMGGILFGAMIMNRNLGSAQHIAVVTSDPAFASGLASEMASSDVSDEKPRVDVHSPDEPGVRATLDAQLKNKEAKLDGYLIVNPPAAGDERPQFVWVPRVKSDVVTRGRVADAARAALTREQLAHSGMKPDAIDALMKPVELSSAGEADHAGAAVASAYGMYFLMYFVILFYGMNVARSIIEEKTSRVFEVLLATIRPSEMLAGKVIGVGAVGLTQVAVWIAIAIVAAARFAGPEMHVLPTAPQAVLFVGFFVLGYLLYSSVAAALGAMVNSEQELQQMQIFLMMPLIVSSVVIFNVITNPDGPIAKGFSFFPFTSPLIMYTRVVVGKPGMWGLAGSIALLVATIALVLWLASRIYRVGILMYGKRPSLPEIVRWLKYS